MIQDPPRLADLLDLGRFTAHDWNVWHVAFVAGYLEGAAVERAEHFAIVDDAARASVRRTARTPPRDVLEEHRYPGELGRRRAQTLRDDHARRDAVVRAASRPRR